ncbi:hypothetical protein P171DRAFT_109756 [Karstenula rhodostoma CBS 690.94]|uniref:Uncharacterized protein n=1 Tax=Karstenula rhodostoma CBS 690.94 TaxID=1392251 RepID=A0A9P4U861_9PLEO|nr:hypothetical protein P171DRAFT_109756 [Karstenula rhodostoma CBS 690.94]
MLFYHTHTYHLVMFLSNALETKFTPKTQIAADLSIIAPWNPSQNATLMLALTPRPHADRASDASRCLLTTTPTDHGASAGSTQSRDKQLVRCNTSSQPWTPITEPASQRPSGEPSSSALARRCTSTPPRGERGNRQHRFSTPDVATPSRSRTHLTSGEMGFLGGLRWRRWRPGQPSAADAG